MSTIHRHAFGRRRSRSSPGSGHGRVTRRPLQSFEVVYSFPLKLSWCRGTSIGVSERYLVPRLRPDAWVWILMMLIMLMTHDGSWRGGTRTTFSPVPSTARSFYWPTGRNCGQVALLAATAIIAAFKAAGSKLSIKLERQKWGSWESMSLEESCWGPSNDQASSQWRLMHSRALLLDLLRTGTVWSWMLHVKRYLLKFSNIEVEVWKCMHTGVVYMEVPNRSHERSAAQHVFRGKRNDKQSIDKITLKAWCW